jgi:protein-S-isoprenylcysteine O-methyltransferase Ste14
MDAHNLFRALIGAVWVALAPVMVYHRLKSVTKERLDRTQEGWLILSTLRPVGVATMVGAIAYVISPSSMAWSAIPLPPAARWAGIATLAAGAALMSWSVSSLGPNLTDTVVTRQNHSLVVGGPYEFVRHPFYDAMALIVIGTALASANGFVLAGGLMAFALVVLRTRREEDRLLARFGDNYRSYMRRTGRFLPGVGRLSTPGR